MLVAAQSEGTGWCWENLLDEILKHILTWLLQYLLRGYGRNTVFRARTTSRCRSTAHDCWTLKFWGGSYRHREGRGVCWEINLPMQARTIACRIRDWVEASSNVLGSGRGGWIHLCLTSSLNQNKWHKVSKVSLPCVQPALFIAPLWRTCLAENTSESNTSS